MNFIDLAVTEADLADLDYRGRSFVPLEVGHPDATAVKVGDVLVLGIADPARINYETTRKLLFRVTHLWTHDGLAPDWIMASVQRVRLATD